MRGGGSATIKGMLDAACTKMDAVATWKKNSKGEWAKMDALAPEYRKGFEDGGTASEYMGTKVSIDKGDAMGEDVSAKLDAACAKVDAINSREINSAYKLYEASAAAVKSHNEVENTRKQVSAAMEAHQKSTAKLDAACAKVDAITGKGDADESYWSYKSSSPTPEHRNLPAGVFKGTEQQWNSLSPGMRREIARQAERKTKLDAACAKVDALLAKKDAPPQFPKNSEEGRKYAATEKIWEREGRSKPPDRSTPETARKRVGGTQGT